jgi:UTP--glucose-1-phosphate uridylyltransferase
MLPVVDKPLIQWAVEEAQAAGIEEFIFVTARGKTSLEDHFDHSFELTQMLSEKGKEVELSAITDILEEPGQVVYTRQQKPLGLGHAVWCARNLVGDEPFAVLLADDLVLADKPCLAQMIETHAKVGGNMVAVMEIPREHTDRYGILDIEKEEGRLVSVRGLIEKPDPSSAPSTLAIIGRYVLAPEIFTYLVSQEPGAGGEIQLTDALAAMIGVAPFHGLKFQGQRFDCGDKCGYLEANIALALEREELREEVRKICRAYS